MTTATGTFDVSMVPASGTEAEGSAAIQRFVLDKQYSGDLSGSGQGQMLAVRSAVEGSAGYVASELITGSVAGQAGSFAVQHSGLMDRGTATATITVVPDSGTGGLVGISGSLEITVAEDGTHTYVLTYSL